MAAFSDLWRRRTPSPSEAWANTLPPTPLRQQLALLHSIFLMHGVEGDALQLAEHAMREIATYARTPRHPGDYPPPKHVVP